MIRLTRLPEEVARLLAPLKSWFSYRPYAVFCWLLVAHLVCGEKATRQGRDQARRRWIGQYRRAGGRVGESLQPTEEGGPHGSPLSPVLSNVRLDDLDKELARGGHHLARSGEDCLLVVTRQRAGEHGQARLSRFLPPPLKLESTEDKSTVGPTHQCRFLGFPFQGPRIPGSPEAVQAFRHRLRQRTGRSWGARWPTALGHSTSLSGAGCTPVGSRSPTARYQTARPGCAAACAGASGNSGAPGAPKAGSC